MLGTLLEVSLVPDADLPVPADELGQLLTVTVVVEAGHAAHSALARGQVFVLEAAAGEEDPSFLCPLAGDETRQELDISVTTAVTVASRPFKSAKSRAATISCAPTGIIPRNAQEAVNKANQPFAYISGMIDLDVFRSGCPKKELSTSFNHGFEISPSTDSTTREARRSKKNT